MYKDSIFIVTFIFCSKTNYIRKTKTNTEYLIKKHMVLISIEMQLIGLITGLLKK